MIRVFEDRRVILENQAWQSALIGIWTGTYANIADLAPGHSVAGNGTGATPKVSVDLDTPFAPIVGHKYYVRPMYKVTNAVCSLVSFTFGGATENKSTPTNGTTYNDSVVLTALSTSLTFSISHTYASAATANGKVLELYQVIIADLTLAYGAGNEPTASIVDAILTANGLTYFGSDYSFNLNDFTSNGDKVIKPIKCLEVKQDNEDWYLDIKCSSEYKEFIMQDYLILAPCKQGVQPFRVSNIENNGREISFKARHVGYDLENYVNWYSFGRRWIGSPSSQLNFVMDESVPVPPYTYSADTFAGGWVTYKESSILGALNEIIATLGGHLVFDWWDVQIKETIGQDNQITIEYGKNLQGAKVVEDWSQVCTVLMPYGNNNLSIKNVGDTLTATGVSYDRPYARKVNFQTDDETELIALGNAYLEQYKVPKINYTVKSDNIQNVSIGDTIKVKARQFTILTNVLGYTYNVLTSRIENVEFGNFRKDVRSVFSNIQGQLDEVKKSVIQENIQMNRLVVSDAFEPYIFGSVSAGVGTYVIQHGRYTKIGKMVHVNITLKISAHTGSGTLRIGGLPFATENTSGFSQTMHIEYDTLSLPSGHIAFAELAPNSNFIQIVSTATGPASLVYVNLDPTCIIRISGNYTSNE